MATAVFGVEGDARAAARSRVFASMFCPPLPLGSGKPERARRGRAALPAEKRLIGSLWLTRRRSCAASPAGAMPVAWRPGRGGRGPDGPRQTSRWLLRRSTSSKAIPSVLHAASARITKRAQAQRNEPRNRYRCISEPRYKDTLACGTTPWQKPLSSGRERAFDSASVCSARDGA